MKNWLKALTGCGFYSMLRFMKTFRNIILGAALGAVATLGIAQNVASERANHPRIAAAISQIDDAIAYMEAAPHDFGGHKAAAIASSKAAVRDLKLALAYRAKTDRGK
jgi:multidrug efflux pump subunit AcrA (membrane-fusion protein)